MELVGGPTRNRVGGKIRCQHIEKCGMSVADTTVASRVVGTGLGVGTTFSFHSLD